MTDISSNLNDIETVTTANQITALRHRISTYGSALVAFSGGVDSTVVLLIAQQELGDRTLGVIGKSPAYPASELTAALTVAEQFHLAVRVVETSEQSDPNYLANQSDRCFHCRSNLFGILSKIAKAEGYAQVLDGVHADDIGDHTGGISAARNSGVRSPLMELGMRKSMVRAIAREIGLPTWKKPALACLASRIPTGMPITIARLAQIERAETALAALGFDNFRVRHHGDLARLELTASDLVRAISMHSEVINAVHNSGYRFVTLDLQPRQST